MGKNVGLRLFSRAEYQDNIKQKSLVLKDVSLVALYHDSLAPPMAKNSRTHSFIHNLNLPRFQNDSLQSCDQKIRFFDIKYCAQHECPFADNWKSNIFTTWYQFAVKIED